MAFVPTPSPTVVDQTTLMKKYLQFVAALTDNNTPDETKLKMMQEVSENFENVTSSPQYSTFLEHIIPRFLTFLQDGEVQFLQEKPTQQLRKLVLEIIHRIPTNEHLRPHIKNILSVMFRFLEIESEENVLICLRIIIELHKQFRPQITQEIHHFLDFVKQIYKELPKVVARYFENPQVIAENTVPSPEMVGMITSVVVKTAPEREDSETRTHTIIPRGSLSLKVLAELPIIVVLMYQLYKLNIHNVVSEFVPLIMNTIMLQVSPQARQHKLYNKELYADFIAAQIKTLSFLAYIIRIYQDLVGKYSQQMVKGMLQLLSNCPSETAHLRKELLIAAKHILTTDLRSQFIPCMDKLFDESILIGSGYTARETLRPLAYSTLADLVHHVRQNLPLTDLSLAVQLFAKNIDDESLPSSIQTMSCKLLLNLVDCIRSKSEQENGNGRDILMRMLEVFVLKFHTIARYQLVTIFKKCKPQSEMGVVDAGALPGVPATPTSTTPALPPPAPPTPVTPAPAPATSFDRQGEKEDKQTFQVSDCRSLVKTLVCGVKTITWGITSCKAPGEAQFIPNKQLQPKETQIYIKLVKYAMQALDIYQIAGNGQTYIRVANCQTVRMKEEKEVLEHFAGVFTMMNPLTFKEIFQTTVPYMVERISKNYALQIVANSFLANLSTSALFATILVEYLLERLPEMGSNVELSNLYLKLFKLVFGSVSLFAAENEQMLKPHLHKIVNSSMELAQSAKEPYNYFLLLRALFRSIGGGSHDLLYQEFLPLLPNLLQGLNMLQSGLHKQHMKDLFVELCLTVPVRLSSLLPYLPMLMDPLVSALNGSQTLVSQGLRTLELCVDNLQPDFLYDHIQPVRAELMQALWRTLRNPAETISHVAYRVLGKFGGSNRKMLKESQRLQYVVTEVQGPSITAEFTDCKASIQLPMEKAIETALDCLKSANTEPYYRRQAWEVIKCFLVAMTSLEDNKHALYQLLAHPNFTEKWIPSVIISHRYKAQDTPARRTFEQALTGAFMSAVIKDLRPSALPFVASLIRHYTMVAVAQQCGPFLLPCYQLGSQPSTAMFHSEENGSKGMDPLVLIDAIAICMAYEEKELCKIGEVALAVIFDVASIILGSKERACQLPLFSYIVERLCACCYEQAWYAKLGGVVSIKFLMERLPLIWVLQNQLTFLKALLFVMMDLTGEVSNGAVAMAKTTLEQLLVRCATPLKDEEKTEELLAAQDKSFHMVTHDLVREVTSPNSTVRKQAMHSLQVLAQVTGKSVTIIMEPHKEVLQDMVPPKKHLLRHQPANAQIGLMEGNTFCTTLQPRLFTMDLNVMEHKVFYTELLNLCEAEDAALMKLPCYKSLPSLVPLRIAALNALAACNYLPQSREKIIAALFKALNSTNSELQEAGEACMRKFLEGATIEVDQIHTHMRPLLMMLGDYRSLTLNVVNRLTSVTRLFPNSFNDKFCDQMMQHLRKWMEVVVITHKGGQRSDGSPALEGVEEMKICSAIINLFHLIPAAPQTLVKPLLEVVMKTERAMLIEAGSPFREPLIKFLTRHPSQTVELFMMEATLNDPQWSRMFMSFLKHKDAKPLRDVLASNPSRFVPLLVPAGPAATARPGSPSTSTARLDLQFQAIKIISIIVKNDEGWLAGQHSLVSQLRRVWVSEAFQERHRKDNMAATNWKEPKLLAYCLLSYCKRNYSEIELLFQLLRAFTGRFLCNMTFLKEYMEEEIPKNYSIAHKRALFFRFVEFSDPHFNDELKAKVLQHILNPAFLHSFEKGEGEQLLGPPNPEGDNPESITSVFITKVLDPEKQADLLDSLRIYLLQFSTLLVEHAPHHIHDNNKSRNSKLRRLMTFAWPCLLSKACVDPACKYSGHLLLAHIIAKFAIHKKIVLQVFHSLLKAHTMEARAIVRQAMAILTPAVPARMEDGHQMLTHWTRKIIVEEGHTVPQLVHILHLIVQHFRVYYPVRHHLVQHMISAMQRLGFTPSVTIEQRKLAVDLAEVVIKWELQRIKDQQPESEGDAAGSGEGTSSASGAVKRGLSMDSGQDVKRFRTATGAVSTVFGRSQSMPGTESLLTKPVEKQHTDTVVNFLIRIACQVNDTANVAGSPGELLSRRCVSLMKTALRPDMWPRAELKLQWFDKLLMTVEQPTQANFSNICTGLEILSFLLTVLQSPAILAHFKPLQRGIAACMTCGNTKVLRAVHTLLSRLMSIFPTEPSSSTVASKYEELECLYAAVGKVIYEGLTNYEKATSANPTQLFGTLMILKSACSYNSSYIDRLISVFMRSLQKMVREHLSPQATPGATETSTVTSELVMLSLDLVKTRLSVMNMEMRKSFIQSILTSLIEKSPDPKILRAVVKIVEEWVKNNSPMAANQMPNLREKSILLVKMMTYIEKRFPDDLELNGQFLDLVNYVYRDESLSGSDITSKLEPAFLSGLRCAQPLIRAKFFEVFDSSMKRRVFERLLYICCSQNWEAMGSHFWIKQCIELLLAVCEKNSVIGTSCQGAMLPSITNVINLADSHDRAAFAMATHIKQEPRERENSETKEEDVEIDIELAPGDQTSISKTKEQAERDAGNQLHMLTNRHDKFLDSLREVKTGALLNALVQLCHISTPLAEKTWIQLFPRLWKILSDRQQHSLSGEMSPFLCSGSHQAQRDCQPSALNCFVEAMSQCVPPIPIRPCVLKYLGKTHNLWLRSTLMLEQQAFEKGLSLHIKPKQSTEFYEQESITPPQQEILDSLAELYSLLQEEDMWAGLWQKRCKFPETSTAIAFEQHGFFEQAQESYEKAMEKARKEHERNNASPAIFPEYQLWEDHWIRCSKELNQWEPLTEYGQSKGHTNPYLVLECAWRVSNWAAMKEALVQVELSCPKEMAWKVNMHRGYLAICHPEEQQLNFIERLVEMASSLAIREWRRLPHIVSHVHTPLLQAAQQIIELQEAAQINAGLQPANLGRNTSLHDMKTVVKTWRNRLPIVSDDLSHWSSIFMWRQHHYQAIVTAYETNTQHDPSTNNAMLGVHASASAIIQYGKIARKQGLVNVALDILSRIHTIPTVPIVDCFQKIRQQVKCYLQLAGVMGKNECMQGLEVIESTNLKYFTKEMTAEFYALKGMFLAQLSKSEEANKAFSAAVQMHDVLVKAWAMWGDYLENIFVKDRQLHLGVSAITCYLHACRHQNESKSRKYLAKVLWLLSFDDKNTLADAVDKYCIGVPPIQWLAWIPQLLTCLVGSEGKPLLNLISQVGRVYPQAVYFPIRTLYLTLKIEQRERYKSDSGQQQPSSASDPGPIRATAPMWRCSRIMHMQRELHPTLLSSLEGIVDQMVWFRENWHEEVLRQLQQGLAKCYSVAFEKSGAVSDAKITPHTLNFVKKLVSTFGVGLENVSNVSTMFSSAASESLARRAQATAQDPVFQKMKGQFTTDFDFSVPGSMKLHNLISKLKKWIKILEAKTKQLPKFFLIEEKCRFLSNFSAQTAEVEIPGEFLMPKPTHYYIKIARFMPRVEIVQKHNTAARRLYIRGHNGKIYPYLVMNDACLTESRREERVLQLLRLLNPCLEKRKETTKRHLFFTVPRVVAVSPQMRLVEDNPSSLSLVEIYKQRCAKKGIEHDNPISRYYDRLATVQARGTQASHQVLRDILKEVQGNMVPRSMLKEWALHTFPNATDYWTFRKMFTIQLALIDLAEFMLHLNRLNPEMLQIAQDTGKLNVSYFRFDINDATGDLDANRPVPFRLTPNISEFLTTIGVSGPLTASMIAVARCFAQPNFKVDGILKAVLRDEIIAWHKKTQEDTSMPLSPAGQPENMDSQQLVSLVQKAVTAIMTRLHSLAQFEGGESKVNTLVAAANSLDNLCRMDPAWHPWL
ncbi:transformation/transcription domain-associated protein isoform X2 [Anguilla anguilla]|uniref:transformation/transcription domain-associated protein isoform X2 n=1 Tax=Anguilla anguilla TaxID=7936 RepID=UPI0015AF638E|nr:transformation/transcription domain-associated protein isoform X2 [Anguilla anguilla]